ncbi:MAG TPA: cytochrome c maturation protein CcmE [Dehalococcoidales bacterium]|nr:cytochrome c maturation protein CcmE [Dehalococcoidales bacterium]
MKNRKFLIGGIIVVAAIGYLSFMGLSSAATYYYEVNEVLAQADSLQGENVRVHGSVEAGSIVSEAQNTRLKFTLKDYETEGSLPVVYAGVVPDTFKDDAEVVVEGRLEAGGVFRAHTLLAKCPSKYEAAEEGRGY